MQFKLILPILLALAAGVRVQAQQSTQPSPQSTNGQQAVTNDDAGRAFIIRREEQGLCGVANQGRTVISEPQQHSIFLGSGWATAAMRKREPELGNLLANVSDQAQISALDGCGIKNLFGATSSQERLDKFTSNQTISDLEIQAVLASMVKLGPLQRPNANSIYVLYLDSELRSTLGTMIAGKHFAAYHNFFNASGVKIHYVVVPFESDSKAANQIALRAFVAAALNPTGADSN